MRSLHRYMAESLATASAGQIPSPGVPRREEEKTTGAPGRGDARGVAGGACARKSVIFTLCSASFLFLVVAAILYTGNLVDNLIQKNLVIKSGSQNYEWWKNPPVGAVMKITMFNYTNTEAYLNKIDTKLKLQEVGPYVYRMKANKVNVEFPEWSGGEIVSFQMNKSLEFAPELSPGVSEDDVIVTPNFNLLSVASAMSDSHYALKLALRSMLSVVRPQTFLRLPAGRLLWGYDDPIFDKARSFMTAKRGPIPMTKFGLMAGEMGVSPDQISVHTGLRDPNLLGVISEVNGEESLPYWDDGECNRVDGSEGSVFPPAMARRDPLASQMHIFSHHLCRRLPLFRQGRVEGQGGVPAVRFEATARAMDGDQPEHRCFCDRSHGAFCPPSGVINVSPCAYGAPVMVSFPHFHSGHPSLVEHFEGLNPDTKHHDFYVDIEPTLGVPLKAESALQMNLIARPSWVAKELVAFPPNLIMPLLWAQSVTDDVPDFLIDDIKFATQTLYLIEKVLMYTLFATGSALMLIVIFLSVSESTTGQRLEQCVHLEKDLKSIVKKCNSATQEKV